MKLYADSSILEEVLPLVRADLVEGVTCNPTILDRAGRTSADVADLYEVLVAAGARSVFFQAVGRDHDELRSDAGRLASLGERAVVKLVATFDGLVLARELVREGRPVLLTAVYTVEQVVAAAAAGVQYVAPYYGRLLDQGLDAGSMLRAMVSIGDDCGTEVLVASVRTPRAVLRLTEVGVRSLTAAPQVLRGLLDSPLTVEAVAEFDLTAARWRESGTTWS